MEPVVLNALATHAALQPEICAVSDFICHRSNLDWHFQPPSPKAMAAPRESRSTFEDARVTRSLLKALALISPDGSQSRGYNQSLLAKSPAFVGAPTYGVARPSSPIPRFARSLTSEIRDSDGDEELDAASVSL